MNHLAILPILVPLVAACLLLLAPRNAITAQRVVSLVSVAGLLLVSAALVLSTSDGTIAVYRLGNWPAPYGIVLVLDRLSAVMVTLTSVLALPVLLHAMTGTDEDGRYFHPFLQLQLVGLNGAFLTGDLFNLFVFFEILLLASYALLAHGGGVERARAGLSYVVLNLTGSAVFLISLGLIYGTLGTLNIADVAHVLPQVPVEDQALAATALALIIAVFLLKAALLPMSLWLPHVYAAACAPVAALFAIMTKVGIYALLRLSAIALPSAPFTASLLQPWLVWLAVATIILGALAALAARRMATLTAALVLISTGTLLAAVAGGSAEAIASMLYYLPHTTLATAGLFILGDAIARERGTFGDTIEKGLPMPSLLMLGGIYLMLAVAVSGAPPLSGFIGKIMLMQSLAFANGGVAVWVALLVSGLVVALVLARAASAYFWEPGSKADDDVSAGDVHRPHGLTLAALALLTLSSPALVLFASPVSSHARATADQLLARAPYIDAVLGERPAIERERRP